LSNDTALVKFVELKRRYENEKDNLLSFDTLFKGSATQLEDELADAMEENGLQIQDLTIYGHYGYRVSIKL